MKVAVIGAGASGIMAALTAAKAGASVTLYEHKDSIGNKILITGNGKCNFTNEIMEKDRFHFSDDASDWMGDLLKRFGTKECLSLFESQGIVYRNRKGGYYPYSDTAESIKSAFRAGLKRAGVKTVTGRDIKNIDPESKSVEGEGFDSIIIACGGKTAPNTGSDGSGYKLLSSLGLRVSKIYPALTPLVLKTDLSDITGIRCDAGLILCDGEGNVKERSKGELQPFQKGFSGICALDISGNACRLIGSGKRAYVTADLYPKLSKTELKQMITDRMSFMNTDRLSEVLVSMFPKKLINYLIHPIDTRTDGYMDRLTDRIKQSRYEVSERMTEDFSRAQTSAGGLDISEIDENCMLKKHKDIYVAGELLDIDGVCGGYNLHLAWATGYVAGIHAARG